jgi:hypothetical protein
MADTDSYEHLYDLPVTASALGTDIVPIEQSDGTKQISRDNLVKPLLTAENTKLGTISGMSATDVQAGISDLNTALGTANTNLTTTSNKVTNLHSYKIITIATTDWSSTTTTVNGAAYYTATKTLTAVYDEHPDIFLQPAGTVATSAEKSAYACMTDAVTSGTTLTLYAIIKPTSGFNITVMGVA